MKHTIFTPDGVTSRDYTSEEVALFEKNKTESNS